MDELRCSSQEKTSLIASNIIINFIPLKTCKLRCPFSHLFFCNLLMFAKNVNLH